jgi:hypothetical protein
MFINKFVAHYFNNNFMLLNVNFGFSRAYILRYQEYIILNDFNLRLNVEDKKLP